MTEEEMTRVADLAEALHEAIRRTVEDRQPMSAVEIANGLAAAVSMVVAYESGQPFLETLAACMDAKEEARAIAAGKVSQ